MNQKVYSWGTGGFGELGQGDLTYTNLPNIMQLDKNNIAKAVCGNSYTVLVNCNLHFN